MRGARPRGSPGQGCPASSIGYARGMTADCEGILKATGLRMCKSGRASSARCWLNARDARSHWRISLHVEEGPSTRGSLKNVASDAARTGAEHSTWTCFHGAKRKQGRPCEARMVRAARKPRFGVAPACPPVSGLTLPRRGSKEQALQRRVTIHSCGGVAEWPKAAVC